MLQSNDAGGAVVDFIAFVVVAFVSISAFAIPIELRLTHDVEASYLASAGARAVVLNRFDAFKAAMVQNYPLAFMSRTIEGSILTLNIAIGDANESARQPL